MHSLAQTNTIIGMPLDVPRHNKEDAFKRQTLQTPVYPWPDKQIPGFKVKLVNTRNDRETIDMLVNERFSSRGYAHPEASKAGNILSLQATIENRVVGTLSVQFDAGEGLPLDKLYQFELDSLRRRGGKLCQFTKLAIEKEVKSRSVLASLFHLAEIWALRVRQYNYICIEVNPRHVAFYQRMLKFTVLSDVRDNQQVQAPSVLLGIDLHYVARMIEIFGGKPELADTERSFYPYLFSHEEEARLADRMQGLSEQYK
ncbi:N-acyl amino acid synthase FeeM domain-containing protein [Undibacterium sp. Tian12W]|uniref:N-acyl amino acid synthase FeeM domain-containing protein n=1 Tax=Undibacterium sp. Tian12W TaxID=3413054 RepID=UPI003BF11580